jgi:hypothetical protein
VNLSREQIDAVNGVWDEALVIHGSDVVAATAHGLRVLTDMEAAGQTWVSSVIDACTHDGARNRVKARAKRAVVHVPSASGLSVAMPARYSRRTASGSVQMEMWMDMPIADLVGVMENLRSQAATAAERAGLMKVGIDLAREYGVNTAREAFQKAGITIAEEVAS